MYYCFGCGAGGNVFSFLMNYDNMTLKTQDALQEAGMLARQKDHGEIGVEHLLSVLLRQEGGTVGPLVERIGVQPSQLLDELDGLLSSYPQVSGSVQLALSSAAQGVLAKSEQEMAALKDKHLWIVVCEGDSKAYPAMNAAVAQWQALGSSVATARELWDPKADPEELDALVQEMRESGADIHYSVFRGGSHMYTWSFAYNIEGIRDWLFDVRVGSEE